MPDPSRSAVRSEELARLYELTHSGNNLKHLVFDSHNLASYELWETLRTQDPDSISSKFLVDFLRQEGLEVTNDPRFANLVEKLGGAAESLDTDKILSPRDFADVSSGCIGLIKKASSNELTVPNFTALREVITEVYESVLPNRSGANAGYIPQLKNADPEKFGVSVCTVDGQQFSIGDTTQQFSIQSCSKPLSYLLALDRFGTDYVHNSVGTEPSGRPFNEIVLKDVSTPGSGVKHSIPHNPMINAGAMMTVSMVYPDLSRQERLGKVIEYWKQLSGGIGDCVGFSEDTYLSESGTADQNWCLGYMMKEYGAFPECFHEVGDGKKALEDTLELYFSICSILNTCQGMSVMAGTLANGGVNPLTGKRVATTEHVRNVLPLMLSSGMYDYSGQWSFDVGVPAKSGVGGCVFLLIPNVCGISIFSPRLDKNGNSVRGVEVATKLVQRIKMHNFEVFSGLARTKIDLSRPKYADDMRSLAAIMFAASQGDISSLVSAYNSGCNMTNFDYDGRTALHMAATEGQLQVLQFLIKVCPRDYLNKKDRWGTTALDDAKHYGWDDCVGLLKGAGCAESEDGNRPHSFPDYGTSTDDIHHVIVSSEAPRLLMAAASGDLNEVVKIHSTGVGVGIGDWDTRTALHLGASEGHLPIIKYLLINFEADDPKSFIRAQDRWGNSALDDAIKSEHQECIEYLRQVLEQGTL